MDLVLEKKIIIKSKYYSKLNKRKIIKNKDLLQVFDNNDIYDFLIDLKNYNKDNNQNINVNLIYF